MSRPVDRLVRSDLLAPFRHRQRRHAVGIADPEAALEKLREFLHLQQQADRYPMGEVPRELHAAIDHLVSCLVSLSR